MNLLLDTRSFLRFIMGSPPLSGNTRALIEDEARDKRLSTASLWEMAIKLSLGWLTSAKPFGVLIPQQLRGSGIAILNIDIDHLAVLTTLPFHHRDPFDRPIIAQASVEQCPKVGVSAPHPGGSGDRYIVTQTTPRALPEQRLYPVDDFARAPNPLTASSDSNVLGGLRRRE
jgi:PIN domain nuclease of toxin-antitoxin system